MNESYLSHLEELRTKFSKKSKIVSNEKVVKKDDDSDKKTMQLKIYEQERKQYHLDRSKRSNTYKIPELAEIMDDDIFNKIHRDSIILQFKKPWSKLNNGIKIDRITNYLKQLKKEHNIEQDKIDTITMKLRQLIDEKILTKKQYVVYDEEEGCIKDIPNLVYEGDEFTFNLDTPKKRVKKEKNDTVKTKKVLSDDKEEKKSKKKKEEISKEFTLLRNRSKKVRREMINKTELVDNSDIKI